LTNPQRAAQLWSLLVLAARTQQILSYTTVERLTGLPKFALGPVLGRVAWYCKRHDLPPLATIVVNEADGIPGYLQREDGTALLRHRSRVFVYDWLGKQTPSEEDFSEDWPPQQSTELGSE
jgi:hypothetical protein